MVIVILRTAGTEERHQVSATGAIGFVNGQIGAGDFAPDMVPMFSCAAARLRYDMTKPVMIVRGDGWETETIDHGNGRFELRPVRARLPANATATALYRATVGGDHTIVGDVAILDDMDLA